MIAPYAAPAIERMINRAFRARYAMALWYPLFLLLIANGAPVVAWRALGGRLDWPVDAGLYLADGRRVLGPSKTVRGVAAAILASAGAAVLTGSAWQLGVAVGAGAMAGDLASSFVKRRLGLAPSTMALGLDQIPESLIPLLLMREPLGLDGAEIAATIGAFVLVELSLSRLLFWLRVRKNPF